MIDAEPRVSRPSESSREVAIKVLPAERMADEDRRRRFVQEARAASALNHPNIVTIHEIDSVDGIDFIVMEYVAGKTLDQLIPRQGMRLGEVLRLAIPMADALARARGAGIVHRDLKPANVGGPGRWQGSPSWSPDGRRIAFDSQGEDGRWDLWTIDVDGGAPRKLTQHPADENVPRWSRDGRWIYFTSERDGLPGIWRVPADGGAEESLARTGVWFGVEESIDGQTLFFKREPGPSPLVAHPLAGGPDRVLVDCIRGNPGFAVADGALYYAACGEGGDPDLHRLDLASGQDRRLGTLEKYAGSLTVSPDGRTILYQKLARDEADLMLIENFQ
jgi:dipeptidyl aminopeptidase/acylaminoacyl peptidase